MRLASAACLLLATAGTPAAQPGSTPATGPDCGRLREGRPLAYRNARSGLAMTYPASFALDPDSIPASGDSARFWTADRRATAVVTAMRNGLGQSLGELLAEARRDVLENSRGTITYARNRDNWFVLSGYIGDRIYYRRTLLGRGGLIGELWIEFPRGLRPCLEAAVTMMSLSFRQEGVP